MTTKTEWCYYLEGSEESPQGPYVSRGRAIATGAQEAYKDVTADEDDVAPRQVYVAKIIRCAYHSGLVDIESFMEDINERLQDDVWDWCEDGPMDCKPDLKPLLDALLSIMLTSDKWQPDHETIEAVDHAEIERTLNRNRPEEKSQ